MAIEKDKFIEQLSQFGLKTFINYYFFPDKDGVDGRSREKIPPLEMHYRVFDDIRLQTANEKGDD